MVADPSEIVTLEAGVARVRRPSCEPLGTCNHSRLTRIDDQVTRTAGSDHAGRIRAVRAMEATRSVGQVRAAAAKERGRFDDRRRFASSARRWTFVHEEPAGTCCASNGGHRRDPALAPSGARWLRPPEAPMAQGPGRFVARMWRSTCATGQAPRRLAATRATASTGCAAARRVRHGAARAPTRLAAPRASAWISAAARRRAASPPSRKPKRPRFTQAASMPLPTRSRLRHESQACLLHARTVRQRRHMQWRVHPGSPELRHTADRWLSTLGMPHCAECRDRHVLRTERGRRRDCCSVRE